MRITVEWDNADHFLLRAPSIEVAPVLPAEAPLWLDPGTGLALLNGNVRPGHQEFEAPVDTGFIRLHATFAWAPPRTSESPPTTVLEITQLFSVMNGTLLPVRWTASGMKRARAVDGMHPLVTVLATTLSQQGPTVRLSTVFVDVTDIWWSLRRDSPY